MDFDIDAVADIAAKIVTHFVKKGVGKTSEPVDDVLPLKIEAIWNVIKNKFERNNDDKKDLDNFIQKPDRYKQYFANLLNDHIRNDEEFACEISKLVKEMPSTYINTIEHVYADEIIGQDIKSKSGGTAISNIKNSKATKITGQRINHLD